MKHPGFQHEALIYEGPDEYLAGTAPFLRAALEAGEPALVAVGRFQRETLEEVAVYTVEGGKITREEFFNAGGW